MKNINVIMIAILLSIIAFITLTLAATQWSPLEAFQEEFKKSAEQKIINQWTKPHTITWANTGRTFKHATKVTTEEQSCWFLCNGKQYYLTGSFLIEEE